MALTATTSRDVAAATLSIVITSAGVPVLLIPPDTTIRVDTPFTYRITASNAPASYSASGLPAGLSLNPAPGLISGTPTVAGNYDIGLGATNAAGTGTRTFHLAVLPPFPAVTSPATASGQVGQTFSYQVTATNSPTRYGAAGLPPGLYINNSLGTIAGAPAQAGTFSVALSATNAGGTGSATLTLVIAQSPAVVTSANSAEWPLNMPFTYQITAANSPTGYGASGLPAGLSVNAQTGLVSGTPTQAGTFGVLLSATNASGTSTQDLTLTIIAPPVIAGFASISAVDNTPFTYQITAANAPASFAATGLPAGLSCDPQTGLISGVPTQAGGFQATLSVANLAGTRTGILFVTVLPQNDARFVSQSVPGELLAGQTNNVSVTLLNVGDTTWTPGAYQLAYVPPVGAVQPSPWGVAQVALPGAVAPGQTATFNFAVTAPSTPGHYLFRWRLTETFQSSPIPFRFGDASPAYTLDVGTQSSVAAALQNAGFEQPALAAGNFQAAPANAGWTFANTAGVTANGSLYTTATATSALEGAQAAYLTATGSMSQATASLPAGTYVVGFRTAQSDNAGAQQISVSAGGKLLGLFTPPGTAYTFYTSAPFTVFTAGPVTVSFAGLDPAGQGSTGLVDDVRIFPVLAVASTSYGDGAFDLPGRISAINFDNGGQDVAFGNSTPYNPFVGSDGTPVYRDTAVGICPSPAASGSYEVNEADPGDYLDYALNVATAGSYQLTVHAGSIGGAWLRVEVDGVDVSGPLAVPALGAATVEADVRAASDVTLSAGAHTVRLVSLSGGVNLAWFSFGMDVNTGSTDPCGDGLPLAWKALYGIESGTNPNSTPDGDGLTFCRSTSRVSFRVKRTTPP